MTAPTMRGTILKVQDPPADASFFRDSLRCRLEAGPLHGWVTVEVGCGHAFFLAPGGDALPPLSDRWEQQGFIPIFRTFRIEDVVRAVDDAGVRWVNQVFDYQRMGTGRIGYFDGPANHPIGVQQRESDSQRAEDLLATNRSREDGGNDLVRGIGWVIHQAADIVRSRDFYADAFEWPLLRGTEGFGYMMGIDEVATLQIAYRGRIEDSSRDVSADPILGVLRGEPEPLVAAAVSAGGADGGMAHGMRVVLDPEGHAWAIDGDGSW